MSLKRLPVNIGDFKDLQDNHCLYVDKTEHIYNVFKIGKAFFLSRPRRFGKSLLLSTINELLMNRKELFKETWIYKSDWKWTEHAIIKLDFSAISSDSKASFEDSLLGYLETIAQESGFSLKNEPALSNKTTLLIKQLAAQKPVAILIDEYDSALLKQLHNKTEAENIKATMHAFYSTIKANNALIACLFITGISRFAKVSIFSGMNHITDLTADARATAICGYTQKELEHNYDGYIERLANTVSLSKQETINKLKFWYNGFQFNRVATKIYNPFSITNCFDKQEFMNYWFISATPSFLVYVLKNHPENAQKLLLLETTEATISTFDNVAIEQYFQNLPMLFYQTGYLTIKNFIPELNIYQLGYPNFEVRQSMNTLIEMQNSLLNTHTIQNEKMI